MIGLDTNVLARYYIEDETDTEAARQRLAAKRLVESGRPLMICKTALLELEWVMRGYYAFEPAQVLSVMRHLLSIPHLTIEVRSGRAGRGASRSRAGLCRCLALRKLPDELRESGFL